MTKKFRQQVRGRTRKIISLLNHGGAHWTQREFKKGRGKNASYCLLGGSHEIIFGRSMENDLKRFDEVIYTTFLATLAEQIDPKRFKSMVEERDAPYERWDMKKGNYVPRDPEPGEVVERNREFYLDCENMVVEFNDRQGYYGYSERTTTWADVKAKLQATIEALS